MFNSQDNFEIVWNYSDIFEDLDASKKMPAAV